MSCQSLRLSWALIYVFLAIFQTVIAAGTPASSPASSTSSSATMDIADKHHTIVYSLPRIGLTDDDDCFLDIYQDELERDMALVKQMGAETVFLYCPWSTATDITHTSFLNILVKYNLSFIVSLETSIYQIEKRGGEKDFQTGLYSLAWELENTPGALDLLKGVYIKYELDGETAEFFFSFVTKVSFWLKTLSYDVALMVPWVQNVGIEEKDIKAQLTQWNSAEFTAWVVLLYSPEEIQSWVNVMGTTDVQKQLYIWYGADSYDVYSNAENRTQQALQIESLYNFITTRVSDGNATIFGSAIHDFADTYYTGSGENMKYGDSSATCPDSNPFLQSSCGRTAPGVDFGDNLISREILGLFEHYESLTMQRCVKARDAADLVRSYWNSNGDPIPSEVCTFAISNPYPFYSLFAPLGISVIGVLLMPILCCVRRSENERQYRPKKSSV